jgi:hypothetical protein
VPVDFNGAFTVEAFGLALVTNVECGGATLTGGALTSGSTTGVVESPPAPQVKGAGPGIV